MVRHPPPHLIRHADPFEPEEHALELCASSASADTVVLSATGELGVHAAARFRHFTLGYLASTPRLIVLDFSAVCVLDAAGVAVLIEIAYEAGEADIGLRLVIDGANPNSVVNVLLDAGYLALFEIYENVAEAVTSAT
jgi:anti-anti-sigma factor